MHQLNSNATEHRFQAESLGATFLRANSKLLLAIAFDTTEIFQRNEIARCFCFFGLFPKAHATFSQEPRLRRKTRSMYPLFLTGRRSSFSLYVHIK